MGWEEFVMNQITLTRQVKLEKYELLMEIGRQEKRAELNSILMLADELGGRVTAADICEKLLIGRPPQVGKAILDRCKYLDLLDEKGNLSNIGRESLRSGEIFVPERGRYVLWYTDDQLFPSGFLHLEPTPESHVYDEISLLRIKNENQTSMNDTSENIPEKISSLEGRTFSLYGRGGGYVHIRKIDNVGIRRELDSQDNLRLQLTLFANQEAKSSFKGKFNFSGPLKNVHLDNYWLDVLGSYANSWDTSNSYPALRTRYNDLNDTEIFTFRKTLDIRSPRLPNLGVFEDTVIQDVPIKPESLADAGKWAKSLLKKSVDNYMDQTRYEKLTDSIKAKFPDYQYLTLPTVNDLVQEFEKEGKHYGRLTREYWYLQAPMDLTERGL